MSFVVDRATLRLEYRPGSLHVAIEQERVQMTVWRGTLAQVEQVSWVGAGMRFLQRQFDGLFAVVEVSSRVTPEP